MGVAQLFIGEELLKELSPEIKVVCEKACLVTKTQLVTGLKNDQWMANYEESERNFILGNAFDLVQIAGAKPDLISDKFIFYVHKKETEELSPYLEHLSKIRFIVGNLDTFVFSIFFEYILSLKYRDPKENIASYLNSKGEPSFDFRITKSTDRLFLQEKVAEFFTAEIERNKEKYKARSAPLVRNLADAMDEMLMNAIWDASPERAKADRKQPVFLKEHEDVNISCFLHENTVILSVSDNFGTMQSRILEKHIKYLLGFMEVEKVNFGEGGAGVGMYMILQRVSYLVYEVQDQKITRATIFMRCDQSMRELQSLPKSVLFFEKK